VVDECGTVNDGATLPEDTEVVTYAWADETDPENLDVIATVGGGYYVEDLPAGWVDNGDGTYTYDFTYVFTDEPCGTVVLNPPTWVDECGTVNDDATLPEDTEGVTYAWADEADPENFDVIATVADGYVVDPVPAEWTDNGDGTFTYDFTYVFTDEECPLIPGDIGSRCIGEVPYLAYDLTLPEGFTTDDPTPLTITLVNPEGEDYVFVDQPLSGAALWPGASATPPLQWPGWELVNGVYVETDGNFAWTREGITVIFEVNPTYQTVVPYPPESSICANPQNPTPAGTPPTGGLAATGSADMMPWGFGGAAALAFGLTLLMMRRFARR
jgi:hypothetical protein